MGAGVVGKFPSKGPEKSPLPQKYEDTSMGPQLSTRVRGAEASPAGAVAGVSGAGGLPAQEAMIDFE